MALLTTSDLATVVQKKIIPRAVDNFFDSTPVWRFLRENRQIVEGGGSSIAYNIVRDDTGNFQRYSGMDVLSNSPAEVSTRVEWDWANYHDSFAISGEEIRKSAHSPEAALSILDLRRRVLEASLQDGLNSDLWAAQAGTSSPTDRIESLRRMMGYTGSVFTGAPSTTVQYGKLSTTDLAAWAPQSVDGGGATVTALMLETLHANCTRGNEMPDLFVGNRLQYARVWSLAQTNQRIGTEPKGRIGFKMIYINDIPFALDPAFPGNSAADSVIVALNTRYIYLHVDPLNNFRVWEPELYNQDAVIVRLTATLAVASPARRYHGVLFNIKV